MFHVSHVFTPAALAALVQEHGAAPGLSSNETHVAVIPVAGDLIGDDRVSRHTFLVLSRMLRCDKEGQQVVQLLLDLAPGSEVFPSLSVVPG